MSQSNTVRAVIRTIVQPVLQDIIVQYQPPAMIEDNVIHSTDNVVHSVDNVIHSREE